MAAAALYPSSGKFDGISGFPQRDLYSRHIPVKRIAPCPPSENIVAEAKRKRLLCPATTLVLTSSCSTPLTIKNENIPMSAAWAPATCFQSYCLVGSPVTSCLDGGVERGLRYDPINSSNIPRSSAMTTDVKKAKCCPIKTLSNAYSTPPYCLNSPRQEKNSKRGKRRFISQRLKRRSPVEKKPKVSANKGCLSLVKNVGLTSVSATKSVEQRRPQSGMNALSVYHSFLKQREGEMQKEQCDTQRTDCTMINQVSSTASRRSRGGEAQYSNNFVPQLTSTPQRSRYSNASANETEECFSKRPRPEIGSTDNNDGKTLTDVLQALEEERRAGKQHIMLPISELTDIVRNFQKEQFNKENDVLSCTASTRTTASNNNNIFNNNNNENTEQFSKRQLPKRGKLPGMYPIGAPRAASSPIPEARKRVFAFDDDSVFVPNCEPTRMRHPASSQNDHTSPSLSPSKYDTNVWRPW